MTKENPRYQHSSHARFILKKLIDDSEYNVSTFGKAMGFADGSPVSKFINGKVNWSYNNICNAAKLLNVASLVFMDDIGETIIKLKKKFRVFDSTIEIIMQSADLNFGIAKQTFHKSRELHQSTIKSFYAYKGFCSLHLLKGKMLINGVEQQFYTIHNDPDVKIYFEAGSEISMHTSKLNKDLYLFFEDFLKKNSDEIH